eukprot:10734-Heterococcus_DN1.PRE.2
MHAHALSSLSANTAAAQQRQNCNTVTRASATAFWSTHLAALQKTADTNATTAVLYCCYVHVVTTTATTAEMYTAFVV